jgi:hypothetical protein
VKASVFETIVGAKDVEVRKAVSEQIQKIVVSRKMESGGAFCDMQGAYMVLNANNLFLLLPFVLHR